METPTKNIAKKFKKSFIIAHKQEGLHPEITAAIEAVKSFSNLEVLEIRFQDYENEDFLANLGKKDSYKVLIALNSTPSEIEYVLKNFPSIEWVQVIGTGVDRILKLPCLKRPEITLTNMRSLSAQPLSEFALNATLFFAKRNREYIELAEKGIWKTPQAYDIECLADKTALVIGLGSIGSAIARKCRLGFDMRVIGVKRFPSIIPEELKEVVDIVYGLDSLLEVLPKADFIYLSLPQLPDIPVVFNEATFAAIKKGAIFVNVGRGSYVDQPALIRALKDGRLLGAGLDVFAEEPLPKDSPFYTDPKLRQKVLNTCHSVDRSKSTLRKVEEMLKENIQRYLEDRPLNYVVNKDLGY